MNAPTTVEFYVSILRAMHDMGRITNKELSIETKKVKGLSDEDFIKYVTEGHLTKEKVK